ncbi:MAG: alpha/beta hydrolase-fold protein [Candidatus Cybelea sp.]
MTSPRLGAHLPTRATTLRFINFHSRVFNNDRFLRVLLPPGYDLPAQQHSRYPVLYLSDGQDLFDPEASTFHSGSWLLRDRMDKLYANAAIPPIIIVGIDNAGHRMRPNEYLPWPDNTLRPPMPHPHGAEYPTFMVREVMPYIQKHFRTLSDAKYVGIGGASYGAQIAIYTVAREPGRFGRLLIESPSVYSDNYQLLKIVHSMETTPGRISIGLGTNEDGLAACAPGHPPEDEMKDTLRLRDVLVETSHRLAVILLNVTKCGRHTASAFGARFPTAVEFLYGGTIVTTQGR